MPSETVNLVFRRHFVSVSTVNPDAVCLFFFIQLFLQGVARRVAVAHFFHTQGGNAAAASLNGAFGEDIADCHANDDQQEDAEGEEQGFHGVS